MAALIPDEKCLIGSMQRIIFWAAKRSRLSSGTSSAIYSWYNLIVSQKMLATFIISVCIFEGFLADIQKLTNIDYVGLGYDVLIGNPHNDLYDPGDVKRFKKHSLPTLTN